MSGKSAMVSAQLFLNGRAFTRVALFNTKTPLEEIQRWALAQAEDHRAELNGYLHVSSAAHSVAEAGSA